MFSPVSLFPATPGLAGKFRWDMHKVDSVWLTQTWSLDFQMKFFSHDSREKKKKLKEACRTEILQYFYQKTLRCKEQRCRQRFQNPLIRLNHLNSGSIKLVFLCDLIAWSSVTAVTDELLLGPHPITCCDVNTTSR